MDVPTEQKDEQKEVTAEILAGEFVAELSPMLDLAGRAFGALNRLNGYLARQALIKMAEAGEAAKKRVIDAAHEAHDLAVEVGREAGEFSEFFGGYLDGKLSLLEGQTPKVGSEHEAIYEKYKVAHVTCNDGETLEIDWTDESTSAGLVLVTKNITTSNAEPKKK